MSTVGSGGFVDQDMDILQPWTVSLGPGPTSASHVLDSECASGVSHATPQVGDALDLSVPAVPLDDCSVMVQGPSGPATLTLAGPPAPGQGVLTGDVGSFDGGDVVLPPGPYPVLGGTLTLGDHGAPVVGTLVVDIGLDAGGQPVVGTLTVPIPAGTGLGADPSVPLLPGSTVPVSGGTLSVPPGGAPGQLSPPQPVVAYQLSPDLSPSVARWDLLQGDRAIQSAVGQAATELGVEPPVITRMVSQHSGWIGHGGYDADGFRARLWGELGMLPDDKRQ
ncbi:MAG: hypothetical protein ACRDZW_05060, partial [Acidimicrobiales bacterium]